MEKHHHECCCGHNHDHEHEHYGHECHCGDDSQCEDHCECGEDCDCHGDDCDCHGGYDDERRMSKYEQAFAKYELNLSDENVKAVAAEIIGENREKYDTAEVRAQLLSTIELTTLTVTDSPESVLRLTERVNAWYSAHPEVPTFATVCVYPRFADVVSQSLEIEGIRVACVSGGFPASQTFQEIKVAETALALRDGADEIDMVLSVGHFLSSDYETCADEISEIKDICGNHALKVILETGELGSASAIKRAALLAMYAGADFVKTSTGKVPVAATPEAALVMLTTIKEFQKETGITVGFKAAGGIKTVAEAIDYYTLVAEIMGESYIREGYFRIGTSRLAGLLCEEVTGDRL